MKNKERMCFGIIIGTRAYFNSELAKDVRKQLLRTLADEGYDYVILPEDATPTGSSSIETREDGLKCAELFRQNRDRIDGIIVSLPNFGFEIGIINAISVADLNVPILVQACDDENDKVDLDSRRDAFCGKISVCINMVFLLQILRCIPIIYTLNYWLRILISSPVSVVWSMVCAMHVSGLSVPDQPVFRRYVPVKNCCRRVVLQSFLSIFLKYSVLPVRLRIQMWNC